MFDQKATFNKATSPQGNEPIDKDCLLGAQRVIVSTWPLDLGQILCLHGILRKIFIENVCKQISV